MGLWESFKNIMTIPDEDEYDDEVTEVSADEKKKNDVDVLLLVDGDFSAEEILASAESIRASGKTVRVEKTENVNVTYGKLVRLSADGLCEVE